MLADAPIVAFVPVGDPAPAAAFYVGVLGLRLVAETPFATVLDAGGRLLRLTPVHGEHEPAPYTVLGWSVADVAATMAGLSDRGVRFERFDGLEQDATGVWTAPGGDQVAWFRDPSGNLLSLTQPA